MKKLLLIKTMLLLCALVVGSGTMWGEDPETISASNQGVSNGTEFTTINSTHFSLSFAKNSSTNPVKYYNSSFRFYKISSGGSKGASVTVSANSGYLVTAVTLTGGGSNFSASTGTYSNGSWTGSVSSVEFSHTNTTAYTDVSSIVVTVTSVATKTNTSLTLSPTSLDLFVGGSNGTLTATVTPEGESALTNPTITWKSNKESVAIVSDNGVVTPVGEGSATITAKYAGDVNYNGDEAAATVTVTDNRTAVVSNIASICSQKTLYIGGEIAFTPSVTLADGLNADDVTYSYVSADPATIRINGNGTYTVLKTGSNIDITVTVTPVSGKLATHKPVSATFQHNGAYRYTGLTLPETAEFNGSKEITMTIANNPQGPIYYTTNGNDPLEDTENRILYSDAFTIYATTAIKARVIDNDGLYSTLQAATYTKVPANKDAITLAAGQSLSFTNFSGLGDYGTDKETYVISSDGDKYKFTSTNVGYYTSVMQIKNEASAYTTLVPVTSSNGFKMTVTTTQNSVKVYAGETEKTAVNGVYYFSSGDAVTLKRNGGTTKVSNITFTGLKLSRSITFPDGNQSITVDGSTITKTATISPTGTATYSSSDTEVATVNATTGEVTAVKGGTAVITATVAADEGYEESKGSYTVTVNKAATTLAFENDEETVELVDGTATFTATATPADVSRTITYSTDDEITVNSSTGAVTLTTTGDFTIKANATATDKYLAPSEASYTLHVVDNRKPVVSVASVDLSLEGVASLSNVAMGAEGTLSATYTKDAGFDGTEVVTFTSSDDDVLIIVDNEFAALKGGTATVTVTITSNGNKMFTTVEKDFEVTVINNSKTATEITVLDSNADPVVDGGVLNLTYGTPVALDVDITAGYEGTISKVLSNSNIVGLATEETTVTITPSAVGSTTLTLSAAETANYAAASDVVLTINVAEPTAQTSTPVGAVENIYENSLDSSLSDWTYDSSVWSKDSQYGAVVTSNLTSGTYDLVSPDINLLGYEDVTVSFRHTGNGQKNGSSFSDVPSACKVYIQEGSDDPVLLSPTYFPGNDWNYVGSGDIDVSAYDGKTVHFIFRYTPTSGNNGKWEILDFVVKGTVITHTDVTIPASGIGTYCYQYPLDLDLLDEDAKAYIVTSVDGTNVTFKRITGTIKGGVPFILYGTNEEHTLYTAASSTTVPANNMLRGTLAPTYLVPETDEVINFIMSGGQFKIINEAGNLAANKAYLPVAKSVLPTGFGSNDDARLSIVFEDENTNTIQGVTTQRENGCYYNLKGQRVDNPTRGGLYIVNGKKVVLR